jgi:putative transcriptional regulator
MDKKTELEVSNYIASITDDSQSIFVEEQGKELDVDLVNLCDSLGMTRDEMAKLLGVSFASLNSWITGRRNPTGISVKVLRLLDAHPVLLPLIQEVPAELNVEQIRIKCEFDLEGVNKEKNRTAFGEGFCASYDSIRSWETGRRDPSGITAKILNVLDKYPEMYNVIAAL